MTLREFIPLLDRNTEAIAVTQHGELVPAEHDAREKYGFNDMTVIKISSSVVADMIVTVQDNREV